MEGLGREKTGDRTYYRCGSWLTVDNLSLLPEGEWVC